jgi:hypothetical protein
MHGSDNNDTRSDLIDQLVSSYLTLPVFVSWDKASGLPFPDTFSNARLELQGLATAWVNLDQIVWQAEEVSFIPGLPARIELTAPSIEIAIGQAELDRWLGQFRLPYRLELATDGLIVHTEIAGFPVAQFETRLEVVGGWFALEPKSASIFGVPGYVSSLFKSYLPLPPLSKETRLSAVTHQPGQLRLKFAIDDFTEEVTPGLLIRLRKRFFPVFEQLSGFLGSRD